MFTMVAEGGGVDDEIEGVLKAKVCQWDGFKAGELLLQLLGSSQGPVGDNDACRNLCQQVTEDTCHCTASANDADSRTTKRVIEIGYQVPDQAAAIGVVRKPILLGLEQQGIGSSCPAGAVATFLCQFPRFVFQWHRDIAAPATPFGEFFHETGESLRPSLDCPVIDLQGALPGKRVVNFG